jgi:hypothetical protein
VAKEGGIGDIRPRIAALMGNYAGTAALLTAFDMQLDPNQPPPAADARDGDLNLTAREWQREAAASPSRLR